MKKKDINQLAQSIVDQATGEIEIKKPIQKQPIGRPGGFARASKLTSEEKADIARLAALSRWKKTD